MNSWTREQDLAVLHLREKHEKRRLAPTNPDVKRLAKAMNRTADSISMRMGNFDAVDGSVARTGLSNPAQLTRHIWNEYRQDPERILLQARSAYESLVTPNRSR